MRIEIPKILRALPLKNYAAELGDAVVWVRVNPTKDVLAAQARLLAKVRELQPRIDATPADDAETLKQLIEETAATGGALAEWYAALWSQHANTETHWTAAEVSALAALETDPALYQWLTQRSWDLINAHRAGEQKKDKAGY